MSHELRTPLNGLIGFAELMHDGLAGPLTDKQREFLGHVLTSGRRFLRVITDVLDLAGLESGQLAMHCSGVDLAALLDEVVASLRPALAAKAQRLSVEVEPACAHVVNDPAMLKQLVYHFVSNAIKFTPVRGTVSVRAMAQSADRFRIEVADTGIGIGPQNLERLFMPFEQLESGAGKPVEGAGVGLALSKRIAEAQGGRVGVDSKPGEGSVFFAVLPRVVPTVA
jgi:signal transduction histidine kinase